MARQPSRCPSCNNVVPYESDDTQATCPQCQAQLSVNNGEMLQPASTTAAGDAVQQQLSATPPPTPLPPPSNRTGLLATLLFGMLALGFAGLLIGGFSLYLLLSPTQTTPPTSVVSGAFVPRQVAGTPTHRSETSSSLPKAQPTSPPPSPPRMNSDSQVGNHSSDDTPARRPTDNASQPAAAVQNTKTAAAIPTSQNTPLPAAAGSHLSLAYHWKPGEEHAYKITIKLEEGGREKKIDGWCNFTVGEPALQGFNETTEATGTAFVVTANGYLITCAHVVEDATTIQVTVNKKLYEASVVDADYAQDLALLRIEAVDLQPIALANSEKIQQGETIHAIGYPLSSLLGTDVKVSQGTLAGLIKEEHGMRFQVDASINPGNSGGPIVDAHGNVIGVASSKLLGVEVTSVGFAIPSNEVVKLLARNQVKRLSSLNSEVLKGPQIVTLVKPSIALVTAKYGKSNRQRFKIRYEGGYTHSVPMSANLGPRFGFGGPGRGRTYVNKTERATGTLLATQYGEIDQFSGDTQFPYVLGHVGKFFLEDFHHHHDRHWGSETQTELQIIERADSTFPFAAPFGPRSRFGPRQPKDQVKASYPAVERTRYTLTSEDDTQFILKKQYEFRTLEDEASPYIRIRGTGEVTVDKTTGMPKSLTYNATLVRNQDHVTVRIPLNVTYNLRDPSEVAAERKRNADLAAKRKQEAEEKRKEQEAAAKVAATVPNPQRVAELIDAIAAKPVGEHWHYKTIDTLSKMAIVEDQRENVVKLAQERMVSNDSWVSNSATVLLIKWGHREDHIRAFAPYLSDATNDVNHWILGTVYGKLGEYDDPRIITALVTRLKKRGDADHAQKALIAIGAACEDALLMAMKNDPKIHKSAAKILKQVGTEKCIGTLERAELDTKDTFARRDIRAAREAVQSRLKSQ